MAVNRSQEATVLKAAVNKVEASAVSRTVRKAHVLKGSAHRGLVHKDLVLKGPQMLHSANKVVEEKPTAETDHPAGKEAATDPNLKVKEEAMHRRVWVCIAVLALLFSGCGDSPYFYENTVMDPKGWSSSDPVNYTFEIDNTTQPYDFVLSLRHGDDYPYSNLFLFVQLDFPNGKTSVDTLECVLADQRGRWNGKRTGQLVDHRILMNSRRIFPFGGTYQLRIQQAMRHDPLPAVHDLGFSLQPWKPE